MLGTFSDFLGGVGNDVEAPAIRTPESAPHWLLLCPVTFCNSIFLLLDIPLSITAQLCRETYYNSPYNIYISKTLLCLKIPVSTALHFINTFQKQSLSPHFCLTLHSVSSVVVCGACGGVVEASLQHRLPQKQRLAHQLAWSGHLAQCCGGRIVYGNGVCSGRRGCL